jgi:tagatose-1,6-bisphosphate aldolase
LDWAVDRDDFVTVSHGVDPISLMQHRLSVAPARSKSNVIIGRELLESGISIDMQDAFLKSAGRDAGRLPLRFGANR